MLSPFYLLINQLKDQSAWFQEETNQLIISDKSLSIEEMLKAGKNPQLALPKFVLLFEEYVQILAYYFNLEEAHSANEKALKIRNSIFYRIENDVEINRSDILFAEHFLNDIKKVFLKISKAQLDKIRHEIEKLLFSNNSDEKIETKDLRSWLLSEKGISTDLVLVK